MFCPNCGMHKSNCICGYYDKPTENNKESEESPIDSPSKIQKTKSIDSYNIEPNFNDVKYVPNQTTEPSTGEIQFKKYAQGNLEFINVSTRINKKSDRPLFLFEDEYYKSEEFVIKYYNSNGYDAFFSENDPWKRLLRTLFKDIFKEFKKISKQKGYRSGFYDNEFFMICQDEINDRINYLKNTNIVDEIERNKVRARSKNKILKICELLDDDQILSILYYMLQDYNNRIRGFPDLLVFNDEGFFFCEVKANTDVLSAYQVRNHEKLLNTGIDVCLFSINKSQSFIKEEKWKYFNEDFYDVDNFKEKYDFKVKTANKIHEELKDYQIDEIKNKFFSNYDLDIYMGFLNIMKDYPLNKKVDILKNIDEIILNQAKKEGTKIKNLRYLSKGMYYEERGLYLQAIEEYKNANDFYGYNQLCICYRKIKDYENEVGLTYDAINNISGIPSDCKVYFKTRAQRFTKNKKRIEVFKTNNKCPVCGGNEVVVVLQRRNNLKIIICDNGSCYWYGGIYESDLNQLEKVTDLKDFNVDTKLRKSVSKLGNRQRRNKQKSLFEKESKPESDGDYAKNLEIKYELILKGESLLNNKDYDESLEFYTELMDHELFINDYYPYVMLVKSYKGLKQHDMEVEVIQEFFKSGRYCKQSAIKRFKKRLQELDEMGYYDYSTINELEEEFMNNGYKNMKQSRVPLPRARDIKSSKNRLKQKPLKYSPDYFDSEVEFDPNSSYEEKIKFKQELISKGESLFKKRKYGKAIAFYTRLINHELFANDYYPYFQLAKVLHKDKRYDMEIEVIEQFFKAGIYCNENTMKWFKGRLRRLTRYGYYDFSKFPSLEYEYDTNGALKEELSNQPVPTVNKIKEMYK